MQLFILLQPPVMSSPVSQSEWCQAQELSSVDMGIMRDALMNYTDECNIEKLLPLTIKLNEVCYSCMAAHQGFDKLPALKACLRLQKQECCQALGRAQYVADEVLAWKA